MCILNMHDSLQSVKLQLVQASEEDLSLKLSPL